MKLSNRRTNRGALLELNMTPMIDMVFLLLIFFITTSAFVATERHLDSAIKRREQAAAGGASDLEPAIVDVVPGGTGFVYKVGSRDIATQQELTDVLRRFPNKFDGAFVRVADEVPFGMAAAAIQACKDANFVLVSYVPKE